MAFDGDGNLYIAHQDDGTIWKVTSDGATSKFVTGLNLPRDIDWGGGTDYGNSLYVADNSGVLKIDLDGTTSRFASVSGTPVAIGIDKGSNYAGELYVGTG